MRRQKQTLIVWSESKVHLQIVFCFCSLFFAALAVFYALIVPPASGWLQPVLLVLIYLGYNIWLLRKQREPSLGELTVNIILCTLLTLINVAYTAILYHLLLLRIILRVGEKGAKRVTILIIVLYSAAAATAVPVLNAARIMDILFQVSGFAALASAALYVEGIIKKQSGNEGKIAELLRMNQENYSLALTDKLTGLYNYRAYQEKIVKMDEYCLLLVDIDHFKKLNDSYGHLFGDKVLQIIGDILQMNLREGELAFRYGGEEFAIVLPAATAETGMKIAERLRSTITAWEFKYEEESVLVSVSIGVSGKWSQTDRQEVFRQADQALYSAKRQGRNRVQDFQAVGAERGHQLTVEALWH